MKKFKILFVLLISLAFALSSTTAKADTIYVQLPVVDNVLHVCQPSGFDTFVFIKPGGWGYTGWSVNSGPIVYGDSLTIAPTSAGLYGIGVVSGVNSYGFTLRLYSAAPSHANFSVTSGGVMSNDTAWMCSPTMEINANVDPANSSSLSWTGPGLSSGDWFASITNPGTYFFEQRSPCDTIVDTLVVMQLPYVLPTFGSDTTFCNTPVSMTLDPGPGWNYSWNTGETTQTLAVSAAGTYTVNLSNLCTSGAVSRTIYQQTYPLPTLTSGAIMCTDSILTLDPAPGYTYDTYLWSTSATTSTIDISGLTTGSGMYSVTVTQGACSAYTMAQYTFYEQPQQPEICIVTVDVSVNKNMVVWEALDTLIGDYSPIASYNVYKWAGGINWTFLGNVLATQQYTFTDVTSNPPVVSARYKIVAVDECGTESEMSYYHQTILLSVMQGQNPGEVPLIWTEYRDESNLFVVDQYQIWRGNSPDSLEYYDQTPFTSYNDVGVIGQKYYQIVVTKAGGCDASPAKSYSNSSGKNTKTLITGSFSNITNNITSGVDDYAADISVNIYPNPSSDGMFHLEGSTVSRVDVMDEMGRVIASFENVSTIDLSDVASGVYYARFSNHQGSTSQQKLVIVR